MTIINENTTSRVEVVKPLSAVFSVLERGQVGSLSSWSLLTWRLTVFKIHCIWVGLEAWPVWEGGWDEEGWDRGVETYSVRMSGKDFSGDMNWT